MKIRSITCFFQTEPPFEIQQLQRMGRFISNARQAFEAAGYQVQTTRLATVPLVHLLLEPDIEEAVQLAGKLESQALELGFEYLSLGPALPEHPESFDLVLPVLAATKDTFLAGTVANRDGVSLTAVRRCAQIIQQAATITPDGFTNLRFAALANVQAGTPFFPAAYHSGGAPVFSLATEAADLAVEALGKAVDLQDARRRLVEQVERHARELSRVADGLQAEGQVQFGGLDFTMAPFPEELASFGTAMERLGIPAVGLHGSLAAAAFLAEALDRAEFRRAGFNGLMLPVLEDLTLARRAADGYLGVKDLLLYSTVCGTGLDTVPLPGDVSTDQLYALLLDVAFLSQRLAKPLTARLMPVPGKNAGDATGFDFAYFAKSRVLGIDAQPVHGLLAEDGVLDLQPRR